MILRVRQLKRRNENLEKTMLHFWKMKEQNKEFFDDKHQLRRVFLNVNDLMLRHDIKLNNKHDFKLIFRWNELFRILKVDSIKKIYILKELNETRLNETYAENRLKRFRNRDVQAENAEKKSSIWRWFKETLKSSRKELRLLKKILKRSSKCWKENLIKLKSWKKINEMFMRFQKMLLCRLMKIMKFLKIMSWTFALIITSSEMSLSLSKLKIENCEMLHEHKIFEINKLKKTFLTKIQKFRLKETSFVLSIIEINYLRTSSSLIKLMIKDRID